MNKCEWSGCYAYASRVHTNHIRGVESYSCGRHVGLYCSLCGEFLGCYPVNYYEYVYINRHFITMHTLKESAGNYINNSYGKVTMINSIYRNFDKINGYRFCNVSNIIKSNPHFAYLVPEFSISDLLDMFDEVKVHSWRLLAAMRHKSFSCLICSGQFESFPSNEVFAAHQCNEM